MGFVEKIVNFFVEPAIIFLTVTDVIRFTRRTFFLVA
jgi:hypothetical protein